MASNKNEKTLLIACGGTGGHLFPGIAVAKEFNKSNKSILLISEKKIDKTASSNHSDLFFITAPSVGLPKLLSIKIIPFSIKLFKAVLKCKNIIKKHNIDAVLSMGGFTSFPAILAAKLSGKTIYLHDSNAIPGKANILNAKFASTIFLGFKQCEKYFKKHLNVHVTGTPIREKLRKNINDKSIDKSKLYKQFSFNPEFKTILIIGGSQGAKGLNNIIHNALEALQKLNVNIFHFTGTNGFSIIDEYYKKNISPKKLPHYVAPFYDKMQDVFPITDISIARSGASTLNELAFYSIPSILIPYPFAAENHQKLNADIFVDNKSSILVEENPSQQDKVDKLFAESIDKLVKDKKYYQEMRNSLEKLFLADAHIKICKNINDNFKTD